MIESFLPDNKNYTQNGDMVLFPTLCTVEAQIGDNWVLNLEHPIDEYDRWAYVKEFCHLRVPSFNGDQLFTIFKIVKTDTGIRAVGDPCFLEAGKDCFIIDKRFLNASGQEVLDGIFNQSDKYKAHSNITKKSSAYYHMKNAMECITNSDNGFLTRWGGEILFDNYDITINDKIGVDNNVELVYGKNIKTNGISETVDITEVVTRIIPKAYKGYILPGSSPWVNSPLINKYPFVRYKTIEFNNIRLAEDVDESAEDIDGYIICQTMDDVYRELINAANKEFDNGIDKPKVHIECKMALLQNTREYREFKDLEKVSLGDTVYCVHDRLKIKSEARVTGLVWDCVLNILQEVTITS